MKKIPISHLEFELFGKEQKEIGDFSLKVFEVIKEKWPTNPLEVARIFNDKGNVKSLSAKYLYHFKKLRVIINQ